MSANGIAHLTTKQDRQVAKLELAQLKRSGFTLDAAGNVIGGPDETANFFRSLNQYDITTLPTQYVGNAILDNPNIGGLIEGRPWLPGDNTNSILLETGYLEDLQLENGNKIYTEV